MMAKHWLPVQGFDEDLADSALGEVGSNAEEIEKVSMKYHLPSPSYFHNLILSTHFFFTSLPVYLVAEPFCLNQLYTIATNDQGAGARR